jgi:hypothetical protein
MTHNKVAGLSGIPLRSIPAADGHRSLALIANGAKSKIMQYDVQLWSAERFYDIILISAVLTQ